MNDLSLTPKQPAVAVTGHIIVTAVPEPEAAVLMIGLYVDSYYSAGPFGTNGQDMNLTWARQVLWYKSTDCPGTPYVK